MLGRRRIAICWLFCWFLAASSAPSILFARPGMAQTGDPESGSPENDTPRYKKPVSVPIEGEIDSWNFDTFKRRVTDALDRGADLLVVPIDTPGGALQAAFDFGDFIFNKLRPKIRVVFYIDNQALSAGALIALAGHEIIMGPGGTIGDCQPIFLGTGGIQEGPEKIQSPIRAVFRKYAKANGYPVALAESMVSKDIAVLRLEIEEGAGVRVEYVRQDDFDHWTDEEKKRVKSKKIAVRKGKLLTMTADEAERFGFAKAVVKSEKELGLLFGIEDFQPEKFAPTWSEEMVKSVQAWNFLFILVGLLCLYLEFKTPGFGFFGIAGIVAFGVYFFFGYLTGLSDYWEIALCLVGLVLIGVEIFVVPGFGVPGLLGIGCVLVGLFAGGLPNEFIIPQVPYEQEIFEGLLIKFALTLAGVILLAILISLYFPQIPVLNRLILEAAVEAPYTEAIPGRESTGDLAVGRMGEAITPLRPTGTARFGRTRMDVVTQGEFIEKGARIRVIRTSHNRIVVVEDVEDKA